MLIEDGSTQPSALHLSFIVADNNNNNNSNTRLILRYYARYAMKLWNPDIFCDGHGTMKTSCFKSEQVNFLTAVQLNAFGSRLLWGHLFLLEKDIDDGHFGFLGSVYAAAIRFLFWNGKIKIEK